MNNERLCKICCQIDSIKETLDEEINNIKGLKALQQNEEIKLKNDEAQLTLIPEFLPQDLTQLIKNEIEINNCIKQLEQIKETIESI